MNKKNNISQFFFWILILFSFSRLSAQEATTVYTEGWVDLKTGGSSYELFIGDSLNTGDIVVTGSDGFAELELENNSSIKISRDTVFEVREVETPQGKASVLACAVGRVGFKFNKMAQEPRFATAAVVGGVRGTEFDVVSAADGSSFIAVTRGQVDISSAGETISLMVNEGIDIIPGKPPGDKINLIDKEVDYAAWSQEKRNNLTQNPQQTLANVSDRLDSFYNQISLLMNERTSLMAQQDTARRELNKLKEEGFPDKATTYYKENIRPLERETRITSFNVRYYALSALSLRRNVLGPLYMEMKSRYILDNQNTSWAEFQNDFRSVTASFSNEIYEYLVPLDI